MKDFAELQSNQQERHIQHFQQHISASPPPQPTYFQLFNKYAIQYGGTLALCLLTGPFNTASVLLQVTHKPLVDEFSKKIEIAGKNNRVLNCGAYGDNKIFKAPEIISYHDCFTRLGKEGLRGMYKGNLTAILLTLSNTKLRSIFYSEWGKRENVSKEWKKNLGTIITCTMADFLTLPLMMIQTRLVLQTSFPNFRTYTHPFNVLTRTNPKIWFSGASLLLLKNIFFSYSWLSFIKESPVYSFILSTVLSHLLIYPFNTIIRQLQCSSPEVPMMHNRDEKVRECIRRIREKEGWKGFYRGFIGYGLVHTFLGTIIVEMNIRKGYFEQMKN